ncbi:polysaccharide lyase family 7 protein [Aquimarina gracilis]|uniref:Polysaccharide lyase family 7 protein n=1 Tax=Aquimarina gracilis TaxID=874422 RepID=A0ABU5ZVK2_9FLAO|nr:polysaccharide lyase family 7 protein [Aquimarina gracilis]MEB3345706.1 polysaccharide lyase family 7 protein [Aquimarina gracilis]
MKNIQKNILPFLVIVFLSVNTTSQTKKSSVADTIVKTEWKLPKIDLSHWKVTLPIGSPKPINVKPPEILDYANNTTLQKYMYNDPKDGALVFYATPGATTTNTKYSRCELREQMVPGKNDVNWRFKDGGRMKATIAIDDISKNKKGKYDKVIVLQIHGRLSNDQKKIIGKKDNDAPPIMKVYWNNGRIRLKSKYLKDQNATDTEILQKDAWGDDEGYNFPKKVGFEKFTIEIIASEGKMKVILNDKYAKVYKGIDMKRWGIFENYFKAGNYLASKNPKAFAKVKFYELEVSH